MRILLNQAFSRFARKEALPDEKLCEAVRLASQGMIDANLGSELIKQRIARTGQGKAGGYRALIAFRLAERAVFLAGFAKKDRDNLNEKELKALKELAATVLEISEVDMDRAVEKGIFEEVDCDEERDLR